MHKRIARKKRAVVQDFFQNPIVQALQTKLSCKTSFKFHVFKLWKQSFRARLPSNSMCSSFANEAFVRDVLQIPTVQALKTKLSCETSFQIQLFKVWKRSFRARLPSKRSFRAKILSNSNCSSFANEAFVRDVLQNPIAQALQTKLSCEMSFKFQALKLWKRSFRARRPSNSNRSSFENEAFVRDFLEIFKVQDVKVTPELAVPLRALFEHDPTLSERVPKPSTGQASLHIIRDTFCLAKCTISCIRSRKYAFPARLPSNCKSWRDFLQIPAVQALKTGLSCESSFNFWKWKMWKRPSNSKCSSFANEAFVRDPLQFLRVEDAKAKLSCKPFFQFWKLNLWKWRLRTSSSTARPIRPWPDRKRTCSATDRRTSFPPHIVRDTLCPAKYTISCIRSLAKTHFLQDLLQFFKVKSFKTKLSYETSFKFQLFKLWKRSFRARLPLTSKSRLADIQTLRPSNFQTSRVSDIRTLRHPDFQTSTSTFRHSNFQTSRISDIQAFRHSNFKTFKLSDIQTFRHPDIQTFKLSGIQTFRHSNFQTFKLSDIQTFRHPDFETFKLSDIQTFKHPFPTSKLSDIQTFQHPFRTSKLADIQTFRHSNFQTSRLSDIQPFWHSNSQTSRLLDMQSFRHPDLHTSRNSDIQTFRHPDFETFKL